MARTQDQPFATRLIAVGATLAVLGVLGWLVVGTADGSAASNARIIAWPAVIVGLLAVGIGLALRRRPERDE